MEIEYIDRNTGRKEKEKIYGLGALRILYGNSFLTRCLSCFLLPYFARVPFISRFYGFLQRRASSAKKIEPFISAYEVDRSEFLTPHFDSFDDFFIRKLKSDARPIVADPARAAMPADGRYLAFPSCSKSDQFYAKGQTFDLASFLQNEAYARRFHRGAMAIARLCPSDYHRFHFPVSGVASKPVLINGPLFSVNPIALRKNLSYLWQNKRMITEIDSDRFGTVLMVEIGATCVGTIHQTFNPNLGFKKGDEKGYFSFGGSCIILLFEPGRIVFDEDLLRNSSLGFETRANFGQSLGRCQP